MEVQECDLTDTCNQMKTIKADIICLAETDLDTFYRPTTPFSARHFRRTTSKDIHVRHQLASSNIT
jgi:hypothetical protein